MEQEFYTITDLMQRYGLTRQGVQKSLDKFKEQINADGLHLQKIKGDWQIDSQGIEILDKARGYNSNVALESELRQARRERELLEEISTLKTAMLKIKEQYQQQQLAYRDKIDALKDKAHAAELLQIQSRVQLEQLEQAKTIAEQQAAAAQDRATAAEAAATQERNKAEAAAKERTDEQNKAAEKLAAVKENYKKVAEENFKLKTSLQEERQKSWLDRLLGR